MTGYSVANAAVIGLFGCSDSTHRLWFMPTAETIAADHVVPTL